MASSIKIGPLADLKTPNHHETLNRKDNGVDVAEFLRRAAEDPLGLFTELRNNSHTQLDRTEELEALLLEEQLKVLERDGHITRKDEEIQTREAMIQTSDHYKRARSIRKRSRTIGCCRTC